MKRTLTYFFCLVSFCSMGQIDVKSDNSMILGQPTNSSNYYKFYINNQEEISGMYIHNRKDPGTKESYGIYLKLQGIGDGQKTGIYNSIYQNPTSRKTIRGLVNRMFMDGGTISGQYTAAIVNSLSFTSTTSGRKIGTYQSMNEEGSGQRYGSFSRLKYGVNATTMYGNYIYVYDYGNGDVRNYSAYTRNFNSSGRKYGYWNTMQMGGTGDRYGYFSYLSGNYSGGNKYGIYSKIAANTDWAGFFVGNVSINGQSYQSSDETLKKDIQPLSSALSVIMQLSPKSYFYKEGEDRLAHGFIAQEVKAIIPELVKTITEPGDPIYETTIDENEDEVDEVVGYEKNKQYLGMNYVALIPFLTKGIQEQQAIIDQQSEEINELRNAINQIKDEIAELKK